jgi:hypothetical protein
MRKTEVITNPESCLNKAADDEPLFVIRAKDACGAETVRFWERLADGVHEEEKREEAKKVADAMDSWRDGPPSPQLKERAKIAALALPRLEAEVFRLQNLLASRDRELKQYRELLIAAEKARSVSLENACELVQDVLDAHAITSIETPEADQWTLLMQSGASHSAESLFAAIGLMKEVQEAATDDGTEEATRGV